MRFRSDSLASFDHLRQILNKYGDSLLLVTTETIRLDSMASLTSLTSISSRSSVEIYGSLRDEIADVEHSPVSLEELVRDAEKIISETFAPDPRRVYTYRKGDTRAVSVNLDEVMKAMLENAEECGGEEAKRYVAAAIVACSRREDVVGTLAALGFMWLAHFLFVC